MSENANATTGGIKPQALTASAHDEIKQDPPEEGRTAEMRAGRPHANVALGADAATFRNVFIGAFRVASPARAGSTAATP